MKTHADIRWYLDNLRRKKQDDYFYGAQHILVSLKNEIYYEYSSDERWRGIEDAVKWFFEDSTDGHDYDDYGDPDTIRCRKCGEYKVPWKETRCINKSQ